MFFMPEEDDPFVGSIPLACAIAAYLNQTSNNEPSTSGEASIINEASTSSKVSKRWASLPNISAKGSR
jgi:hypothetical protein